MLRDGGVVFAGFASCSPENYPGRRVAGALFEPLEYHPRDFEWALSRALPWVAEVAGLPRVLGVYRFCVRGGLGPVLEGLEWLIDRYSPCCLIHGDIGGDGLVTGYERALGSFTADSIARAALYEAGVRLGVRGVVAVGGVWLEGGARRSMILEELVADLLYYESLGALLGVLEPPREAATLARLLLSPEPGRSMFSVMLPLYAAALEGRGRARVRDYSGVEAEIEVPWWARYVFLLDAVESCRASPACLKAREGVEALKRLRKRRGKPQPPPLYLEALERARRDPEGEIRRLVEEHLDNGALGRLCAPGGALRV